MDRGKRSTLVYIIIIVLGLVSLGLSIAAVQRRNHLETDFRSYMYYDCETDAASTGFGIVAFLLLLFTQIMVMVVTSCLCGGGQLLTGGCCVCSVILLVFSWLSFLSAEADLLAAMVANSSYHGGHYGGSDYEGTFSCSASKVLFLRGAIFAVLTMVFNVFYYMCYTMTPTQKRVERIDLPANPTIGMTPSA